MGKDKYNTQRTCGVWLVYMGTIIIISAISGGELLIQPFVLGVGGFLGYLIIFMLPFLNRKLAYGKNSKFQDKMDNINIIVTIILCTLCGLFIGFENSRVVWLSILIVIGIHFFGFYFSQGKWMIVLGILTITNGSLGVIFVNIPFLAFASIDGLLKIAIGFKMLFIRRKFKNHERYFSTEQLH